MGRASAAFGSIESAAQTMDWNFRAAAHCLNLSTDLQTVLATPWREVHLSIPTRMDNGNLRVFDAIRVQHNCVRGPSLGALRFDPAVDSGLERALAQLATWRCALVNVPFGGASSGIACDPTALSARELEALTREFTVRIRSLMGEFEDILAPDANTSSQTMAWVFDEYSSAQDFAPASVSGKPIEIGGILGFDESSSAGLAVATREVAARLNLNLQGARVIVQGFSGVARRVARQLVQLGCKITGVSDAGWALYCERGLDLEAILANKGIDAAIEQHAAAQPITPEDLFSTGCDILLCAAAESALNGSNAGRVRARMIIEASNLATTPTADEVFEQQGITVVPDLLANAGAVIASYFEWEQNLEQKRWSAERVRAQLETMMIRATRTVLDRAVQQKVSLRAASCCIALERVARMEKLRSF